MNIEKPLLINRTNLIRNYFTYYGLIDTFDSIMEQLDNSSKLGYHNIIIPIGKYPLLDQHSAYFIEFFTYEGFNVKIVNNYESDYNDIKGYYKIRFIRPLYIVK